MPQSAKPADTKQPVSTLFSKVLNSLSPSQALPSVQPPCNTLCLKESRLMSTRKSSGSRRGSTSRPSFVNISDDEHSRNGIRSVSSMDSTEELSKDFHAVRRLSTTMKHSPDSEPVSRSTTLDELEPRRLLRILGSGNSIHEKEYHDKLEVHYKRKLSQETSLSSLPPCTLVDYGPVVSTGPSSLASLSSTTRHSSHSSNSASIATSRRSSLVHITITSAPSSRRGSAQASPVRNRHSAGTSSMALQALNEDATDLQVKLLEAFHEGKFSIPRNQHKKSLSITSPLLTPLRTPSPARFSHQGKHFFPSVSSQHDFSSKRDLSPLEQAFTEFDSENAMKLSTPHMRRSTSILCRDRDNSSTMQDRGSPDLDGSNDSDKMSCNRTKEEMAIRVDERNRRRSEVLVRREERRGSDADKVESFCASIQEKFGRSAKKVATSEAELRRLFWLKAVTVVSFGHIVVGNLGKQMMDQNVVNSRLKASAVILRFVKQCRLKRVAHIRVILLKDLGSICILFSKLVARWRMRFATKRIKSFLSSCLVLHVSLFKAKNVLRFVKKVRIIQRIWRDFLACKKCRMIALSKMWEAYEWHYLSSVVQSKASKEGYEAMPHVTFLPAPEVVQDVEDETIPLQPIKSNHQRKVSSLFEKGPQKGDGGSPRFHDFIKKTFMRRNVREVVLTLLLPKEARVPYLDYLVSQMRCNLVKKIRNSDEDSFKAKSKRELYTLKDAMNLVTINSDRTLLQITKEKMDEQSNIIADREPRLTFVLYKNLFETHSLYDTVREAHTKNSTFLKVYLINLKKEHGSHCDLSVSFSGKLSS